MVDQHTLMAGFARRFSGTPAVWVRAPGRVNLIGEHVDYNGGLVLPIAIERATCIAAAPADGKAICVHSASLGESVVMKIGDVQPPAKRSWDAYPRGVAAELHLAGVRLRPANLYLDSDVPIGGGLSSSAALEVSTALALLSIADATMPRQEIVRLCRRAEHRYAGVPCGIMDQFVCAMAEADAALLIDCREESSRAIRWPADDVVVLVIDSQCRHKLTDGMYAARVKECRCAVEGIHPSHRDVTTLRDATLEQLEAVRRSMDKVVFRRARHVITEIQRTALAVEALQRNDFSTFGQAMNESHESLRQDYEVSAVELDDLAAVVRQVPGVYGARMTGAGMGGCIVAVAERRAVAEIERAVRREYDPKYGVTAPVMVTRPSSGATVERIGPA